MSGDSDEYTPYNYERDRYQRSYPYGYTRGYDARLGQGQSEPLGQQVRETVSEVKDNVQETAEHARERVEQISEQV